MDLTIDNRDSADMLQYYEARIEALKRRIKQLETENRDLTIELLVGRSWQKGIPVCRS